jgi:hypothetical protein
LPVVRWHWPRATQGRRSLSVINVSWLAESGNVARIEKLLSDEPEVGELLKSISTTDKKPLLASVEAWIATGPKLAKIGHEREDLEAKEAKLADKTTIQAARSQWFRTVTAVLNNLEISTAPQGDIDAIRGPMLRASERAGKRYGAGQPDAPVLDPGTPASGEAPEEPGAGDAPAAASKAVTASDAKKPAGKK